MSLHIDALADLIRGSINDSEATREDWQRAITQVFGEPSAPLALDPLQSIFGTQEYSLSWHIESDGNSAADAAARTWRETFRRGYSQPSADDACVFLVTEPDTGATVEVDLSEERFADLFS